MEEILYKYLNTFWCLKGNPEQLVYIYKAQPSNDNIILNFYVLNKITGDLEVLNGIEFKDGEFEEKNTRTEPDEFINVFEKSLDVWKERFDYLKSIYK